MREVWSQHGRVALERDFWIAVMKAQRDLGVPIPADAIKDYERVKGDIDLGSIDKRERANLHDVKARIEEFSDLAKRQFIHLGLDEQGPHRKRRAAPDPPGPENRAVQDGRRAPRAGPPGFGAPGPYDHRPHPQRAGPAHNPRQADCDVGQELIVGFERLEGLVARYPVRGLKGAVGTQLDQLTLLGGDAHKVADLETRVLKHLGFRGVPGGRRPGVSPEPRL